MKKYSKILKQEIEIDKQAGVVKTADGCIYKSSELKLLANTSDNLIRASHEVKKMFQGEVVKNENR